VDTRAPLRRGPGERDEPGTRSTRPGRGTTGYDGARARLAPLAPPAASPSRLVLVLALAIAGATLGALLQATTGIGYALVAGPALLLITTAPRAIATLLLTGVLVNVLMLARVPRPAGDLRRSIAPLLAWSLPGLIAGVLLLEVIAKQAVQVVVGVAVLGAVGVTMRPAPRRGPASAGRTPTGNVAAVGLACGALTTATSVNGPLLLLLWLNARQATAAQVRDALATCFLALNLLGACALALLGNSGQVVDVALLAELTPGILAGTLVGRRVFAGLDEKRFRAGGLVVATVAGLTSIVAGLAT